MIYQVEEVDFVYLDILLTLKSSRKKERKGGWEQTSR
jgi:hypothetical protein